MTIEHRKPWLLAAYYWSPYIGLAVLEGHRIVEITSHHAGGSRNTTILLASFLGEITREYAPDRIIVEPRSRIYPLAARTHPVIETMSVTTAKQILIGAQQPAHHADLYRHLARQHPELKRLIDAHGGSIATVSLRGWLSSELLAVALGLAAHELTPRLSSPTTSLSFRSP